MVVERGGCRALGRPGSAVRASDSLVQQLDEFFGGYHKKRFFDAARELEKEGQSLPAAEAYACFLASEDSGALAGEARRFLDRWSRGEAK